MVQWQVDALAMLMTWVRVPGLYNPYIVFSYIFPCRVSIIDRHIPSSPSLATSIWRSNQRLRLEAHPEPWSKEPHGAWESQRIQS